MLLPRTWCAILPDLAAGSSAANTISFRQPREGHPMPNHIALPVRRFLKQHLVAERSLSQQTILAYRYSLKLLLAFATKHHGRSCEELTTQSLSADTVRQFWHALRLLEKESWTPTRSPTAVVVTLHWRKSVGVLDFFACQQFLERRRTISGPGDSRESLATYSVQCVLQPEFDPGAAIALNVCQTPSMP
jgi:hypothetical protein